MANTHLDVTSILLRRGTVTAAQLEEAQTVKQQPGERLEQALVRLGYASPRDIAEALAEACGLPFLDLTGMTIPAAVLELVPESVARENIVLPLASDGKSLWVVVGDPCDRDTLQKLAFILNRDVRPVVGIREQIIEAIQRHYGQTETESVDSMLAELTDTAIDFTEIEELALGDASDECLPSDPPLPTGAVPGMPAAIAPAAVYRRRKTGAFVERQATVRYYHRMNPERMFPLLVVLSKKAVQEVVKRGVAQARSGRFRAEADSFVEIEPVLPGCHCHPPRERVLVREENVSVTFWVVPHVLGRLMHARVIVRQEGRVLAEVPLEARVVKQTLTVLLGALGVVLPFVFLLLKHFRLDVESQLDGGFDLYARAAGWALQALSPELLCGLLLAAAAATYFWLRPRRRDVFWDVKPEDPAKGNGGDGMLLVPRDGDETPVAGDQVPDTGTEYQSLLLARAEDHYRREGYAAALRFYDSALALGPASALVYHHHALAAHLAGDTPRALAVLREAEAKLGDPGMRGPMWYNWGCFAARLGQFDEAMHYLRRAADRGCTDPGKYRSDPDLAPLRWRGDFKQLVRSLGEYAGVARQHAGQ